MPPRYLNNVKKTIGWCDYTWNPVTGCLHGCPYCYAASMARRFGRSFKPEFHPDRLDAPSKMETPSLIFVGSVTDMYGEFIPQEWRDAVYKAIEKAPQHRYLFLTKNPSSLRFKELRYIDKYKDNIIWYGMTATRTEDLRSFLSPTIDYHKYPDYISIEPLLGEIDIKALEVIHPKWIILGARTPYNKAYHPKREWVEIILEFARTHEIPTYLKDNLRWTDPSVGSGQAIKEFPVALKLQTAERGAI